MQNKEEWWMGEAAGHKQLWKVAHDMILSSGGHDFHFLQWLAYLLYPYSLQFGLNREMHAGKLSRLQLRR